MASYRLPIPGVTSVTTWSHRPQPQQSSADDDSRGGNEDPELVRRPSGGRLPTLPGTQKARTMAAKAAKATSASTKGATKMASAFGRKFRFAASKTGEQQAISAASPSESENIMGRQMSAEGLDPDDADSAVCEADPSWDGEDTSMLLDHAQYSPQSNPSTDQPRSPDCQDRSDLSSKGSASTSDLHSQGSAGSDSDAIGRGRVRFVQPPVQRREPESWDAKAFVGNTRPLECPSIWQIPTSRVPKPEPASVEQGLGMDRGVDLGTPQAAGLAKLPGVPVKLSGGQMQGRARHSGLTAAVVCLSLSLFAAAVVGAYFFM